MNQKLTEAEVLQENYKIPNSLYDGRLTKTSQFMLPAIGINGNNKLFLKYFENAFLTDREHKHNYNRPIFMLFSVKDFKEEDWKRVYLKLVQSKNYITEYDVGIKDGKYLIMIVFKVHEKYEKDYDNFRIGKYSHFSEEYKKKFPEFLNTDKKKKNILWQIVNKDTVLMHEIAEIFNVSPIYLKDEIWEAPRKEREFYRFKILKDE